MPQLTSSDRTSIAYEQTGHGPAVVLIHVGPFTQALNAGLAGLLAGRFTVYTYDRRGRGKSGGTITDGPDREFDDLRAVIDHAGGHAHVYGSSGALMWQQDGRTSEALLRSTISANSELKEGSARRAAINRTTSSRVTTPLSVV